MKFGILLRNTRKSSALLILLNATLSLLENLKSHIRNCEFYFPSGTNLELCQHVIRSMWLTFSLRRHFAEREIISLLSELSYWPLIRSVSVCPAKSRFTPLQNRILHCDIKTNTAFTDCVEVIPPYFFYEFSFVISGMHARIENRRGDTSPVM